MYAKDFADYVRNNREDREKEMEAAVDIFLEIAMKKLQLMKEKDFKKWNSIMDSTSFAIHIEKMIPYFEVADPDMFFYLTTKSFYVLDPGSIKELSEEMETEPFLEYLKKRGFQVGKDSNGRVMLVVNLDEIPE